MRRERTEVQLGECVERLQRVLRRQGGRLTEERRELLELVLQMPGHFSPEDVVRFASERGQRLAVATVYRNVPVLIEAGIVGRAPAPDGSATRFEVAWNREHHDHLYCSRCGRQVEFSYPAIDVLQEAAAREHGFVLERHSLVLVGVCPQCRAVPQGQA